METNTVTILTTITDVLGIIIILRGVIKATRHFVLSEEKILTKNKSYHLLIAVRYKLASYLLLGLEFFVASDIIATIIKPDVDHLIRLALLVLIRIIIGYFLNQELAGTAHPTHKKDK